MPLPVSKRQYDEDKINVADLEPGWHKAFFGGIFPRNKSENYGIVFNLPDVLKDDGYTFSVSKTLFANDGWSIDLWLMNAILEGNGYKPVGEDEDYPPLPYYDEDEKKLLSKHPIALKLHKKSNGYWEIVQAKPIAKFEKEELEPYDGTPQPDKDEAPF